MGRANGTPYNSSLNNYQQLPSSGNTLNEGSVQMMDSVGGSQEIHYCPDIQRFILYGPYQISALLFSKYPKHGDIFRYHGYDEELFLDFVSTDTPQEDQGLPSSQYPSDGELVCVDESRGFLTLSKVGDKIFTFHEENRTASYYFPDKDIVLHFTRVPRDGDTFCGRQNDGVVILEALSTENSEESHNKLPLGRDLYRVHEGTGEFSVMKLANNKDPYLFGRVTQEENSTFTYYLQDKDMAFHFTSVPTHDVIFRTQQRNNIMILDMFPPENFKENPQLRSYGCQWNIDFFRVHQTDDGFELVRTVPSKSSRARNIEEVIRRNLKIRRHIASNTSSAKEDDACAVCLAPYKDFDRVGSMVCGHEYHLSCIIPWIRQNWTCFICKRKLSSKF